MDSFISPTRKAVTVRDPFNPRASVGFSYSSCRRPRRCCRTPTRRPRRAAWTPPVSPAAPAMNTARFATPPGFRRDGPAYRLSSCSTAAPTRRSSRRRPSWMRSLPAGRIRPIVAAFIDTALGRDSLLKCSRGFADELAADVVPQIAHGVPRRHRLRATRPSPDRASAGWPPRAPRSRIPRCSVTCCRNRDRTGGRRTRSPSGSPGRCASAGAPAAVLPRSRRDGDSRPARHQSAAPRRAPIERGHRGLPRVQRQPPLPALAQRLCRLGSCRCSARHRPERAGRASGSRFAVRRVWCARSSS